MPTYEYECAKCGHHFERFQQMSDQPVKTCPECKSRRVQRLLGGGAGLLFKGSGFYITDYRSGNYKEGAKNDTPAATATSADSSSTKKEKAPPAKPAAKPKPAKKAAKK